MSLTNRILQAKTSLAACWLGNDGWLLSSGGHIIATDPDLFLEERSLPRFEGLRELAERLEYILISHAHTDHFNPETVKALIEHGPCAVILPESCRACAAEYGLNPARLLYARPGVTPLDPQNNPLPGPRVGGEVSPLPGWIRVEAIRALHGHVDGAIYAGANAGDCGYIIHFGGKRIVQPGDSVLIQEHLDISEPDLLLVSPTEHNMGVEAARRLIERIRPKRILAQHFGTYRETPDNAFWTHGYPKELYQALTPEMRERYTIPEYTRVYLIQ